jgi:peptidoglycan/LPS O-acetylase OafA/YrhL
MTPRMRRRFRRLQPPLWAALGLLTILLITLSSIRDRGALEGGILVALGLAAGMTLGVVLARVQR